MQFSSNSAALLLLRSDQAPGHFNQTGLGCFSVGNVHHDADQFLACPDLDGMDAIVKPDLSAIGCRHAVIQSMVFTVSNGLTVASQYLQRSEEHTSELQSRLHLVCRLLLEKKKYK